jgi:predicted acyl esterase
MNQWQVATLQPPHLKALCIWEGAADYYREMTYHGGILCTFGKPWYEVFILSVQNGRGVRGMRSLMTDDWVSGPDSLTDEELGSNRCDWHLDCRQHALATDEFWTSRRPDFSKINIPLLSAANWGGQHLHLRGNVEGFVHAASEQKWLEFHGEEHWTHFYTDYGFDIQKRFFGRFLKDEDNGWDRQPKILMQVRHPGERFVKRYEKEWPLARTQWTKYYLKPDDSTLQEKPLESSSSVTYQSFSQGVTFMTPPLQKETEITGPMAAKLFVSSSTGDADLFLVVRVFGPDLKEVTFQGTHDMHSPISLGWLRASHRKLDPERSLPYRPYHVHDEIQKLSPGQIYELDIEILPGCIAIPKGYRLALSVRGKDYEYPGGGGLTIRGFSEGFTGVGPFRHNDPVDRPASTYNGDVVVHCGPQRQSYLLVPVIPST